MKDFFGNVVALPDSGRDATTAFTSGTGDVLLSYENEAILARQSGTDFDYVVPDTTLLIQNPCAVTTDASAGREGVPGLPEERAGPEAVRRDRLPPADRRRRRRRSRAPTTRATRSRSPTTLLTIDDDFGGWDEANTKFFDENDGILTKIQAEAGQ